MLINPYRFASPYDTDAQTYITAVETADGQTLETGVKDAINAFVVGCKADGIWTAIKASCILAGARTLSGALVPLVGPAPTNNNFVAGNYNRKTGLAGNGSNSLLSTNYTAQSLQLSNNHICVNVQTVSTSGTYPTHILTGSNPYTGIVYTGGYGVYFYNESPDLYGSTSVNYTGLIGSARNSSAAAMRRVQGVNTTFTVSSTGKAQGTFNLFGGSSNARLNFYSIGDFLNLALLDSRVTTLINALAAAIP